MQNRTMNVYYGIDRLPYKDEARETHYPIISSTSGGNLIIGENNTSTIRFFVGLIGGANRQWIANIKKPDGTLSYQLLSGQASGSDYVCNLDISNLYTDQTGACFISLQGYSGETVITEDEGSYEISGNPVVIATGVVKVMINYAPNVFPKGETLQPTTEQQILANFSNYQQKYILENVRYYQGLANYVADLSNIANGQLSLLKDGEKIKLVAKDTSTQLGYVILYCDMADKAFKDESGNNIKASYGADLNFQKSGAKTLILQLINKNNSSIATKLVSFDNATTSADGFMSKEDKSKLDGFDSSSSYLKKDGSVAMTGDFNVGGHNLDDVDEVYANTINTESLDNVNGEPIEVMQDIDMMSSSLIKNLPAPTNNGDAVNKYYVDTIKRNAFIKVDTTTYPTLNDFLQSTGEEGFVYLYPIDTGDLTKGYYQYIWEDSAWVSLGTTHIDLSGYVQTSRTIVGIPLTADITKAQLQTGLGEVWSATFELTEE